MAHVFGIALCAFVIYLAKPGTSLFSWHPTFMILGFGLFMFEAILIFSPHSSLLASYDRSTKVKWHWILNILANISIFLGFATIYYNKDLNNKPHFTSWHGTIGGVSVAITLIQSICAISLIYYNVKWFNPLGITLRMRKQLHAVCGALSFVIGYFALLLSLYSKFIEKNTSDNSWYVLFVLMSSITSVVVNQVCAVYVVGKKPTTTTTTTNENIEVKKVNPVVTDTKWKNNQKHKHKSPPQEESSSQPRYRYRNNSSSDKNYTDANRKAATTTIAALSDEETISPDVCRKPFSRNTPIEEISKRLSITNKVQQVDVISEKNVDEIIFDKPPSPISNYDQHPSPISSYDKPPSPISNYDKPPSPISDYDKPPSPLAIFTKPPSPLSIFTKPPSPLSIFMKPPSPFRMEQVEEVEVASEDITKQTFYNGQNKKTVDVTSFKGVASEPVICKDVFHQPEDIIFEVDSTQQHSYSNNESEHKTIELTDHNIGKTTDSNNGIHENESRTDFEVLKTEPEPPPVPLDDIIIPDEQQSEFSRRPRRARQRRNIQGAIPWNTIDL